MLPSPLRPLKLQKQLLVRHHDEELGTHLLAPALLPAALPALWRALGGLLADLLPGEGDWAAAMDHCVLW